jgi:hypothetical protein
MRPFGLGLIAAITFAVASPALAAPKATPAFSEAQRKTGMAKAPEIIAQANLACGLTDARFVGSSEEKKDGVKVTTSFIEVACSEGLGYVIQAKTDGSVPVTYDCVATSAPAIGPDGKQTKNSLGCLLPGNANPMAGLQPLVAKSGSQCAVDKARYIGQSPTTAYYEVACKTGAGIVLLAALPATADRKITNMSCVSFGQSGRNCELTTPEQNLAPIKAMMAKSGKTCEINNTRFVLATIDGSEYYELACQAGDGYMLQVQGEALAKTIKCADAAFVGGGCTLTDAREAETQQAGLYSSIAKKAGFDCDVAKYAAFPVQGNDKEVVELACKNRADGAVGIFPTSAGVKPQILDCVRSQLTGYRCSFSKQDAVYPKLTSHLKSQGKSSCIVSNTNPIGRAETSEFLEVACSDGLPGWVIEYVTGVEAPKSVLSCTQAKTIGGGCKLPGNTLK